MACKRSCSMLVFLMFISVFSTEFSHSTDTLLPTQSISDGQTLVSANNTFELGFFSPNNSSNRYLGIWYHQIPQQTIVWTANRDSPIADTSGLLKFSDDGDLMIVDGRGSSTTVASGSGTNNTALAILDSGNLVLRDANNLSRIFWQSFDSPTDTFLPGMKLGRWGGISRLLTSWRSDDDPARGDFSLGVDPNGSTQIFIWQKETTYWTSGVWNGRIFSLVPEMTQDYIYSFEFVTNGDESYFTYHVKTDSILSRLVMDSSGKIQQTTWMDKYQEWILFWAQPKPQCDVRNLCGAFGVCNENSLASCQCLEGFEPASLPEWNNGYWSHGCLRKTSLQCNKIGGEKDAFLNKAHMRFPLDAVNLDIGEPEECKMACLNNCSCNAYTFSEGCNLWYGDLKNLQENYVGTESGTLYLRLAASELASGGQSYPKKNAGKKRLPLIMVTVTASFTLFILCLLVSFLRIKRRRRGIKRPYEEQSLFTVSNDIAIKLGESEDKGGPEFSLFHFSHIADATNNFSADHKLGEGGFGPVYKGQLPEGHEIAVKRLAAHSGQGLAEFKNEVLLIAKLQHRNLVRLLGCCIQGDQEKILIYEYMPNKSLDFFLFDAARGALLDWGRRLHIIEGIAQGLLYLHKHSRLRIIHRDLKASNILLDADMNPKISDFGLARIFGSNETQANTNRIVGTYGYMSPEYAAEGLFSIKSDVFSFGVLLLEIVSGKRNAGFHQYGNSINLLGFAWELWKEGKWLELIDPSLADESPRHEISRCIHVALMCVQENAADRPTMSDVVAMLTRESSAFPDPKQPGFFTVRIATEGDSRSNMDGNCSLNNLTITFPDGR
ncbi:G-type lectin S-receptor-like serine/threonine-protein kinase At4g27290 isoform X1 [Elaeis guineensis]|uniref:Receptor-like serine/threonine-protein kinase n=1 Tax=Elaeis guineensis var. tenera TaxID=51953 RepID=A0A6J0PKX1_ELAGV|nr:G-type lectin S-receptor-like serine/threonine-protein kinase At1g11300 [Elaeis guineensis]